MYAKERPFTFMNVASYYDIPFFQRAYVWGETEWEALLANFLDSTESNFLGSIILKQEATKSGESSRYMVIDGQQRLTTLSILLRACYDRLMEETDKYEEDVIKGFGDDMRSLLFIKPDKFSTKVDVKINHSRLDKTAYQAVVNGDYSDYKLKDSDPRAKQEDLSRIVKGYFYFRDELHDKEENDIRTIWNLLTTDEIKFLVNIDLGVDENEQKIFDTVNSTGVRLTSADTIKNAVFQKYIDILRIEGVSDIDETASNLYETTWDKAFIADEEVRAYWETTRRYGRLSRDNIEVFLNSFAVINGFFDPSTDNVVTLPEKYKSRIKDMDREELESFLGDMQKYADLFRKYFSSFDIDTMLSFQDYRLRLLHLCYTLDVATFYPYILKLLYQHEEKGALEEVSLKEKLGQLERYIVLNAICGGSTKNYNNECVQLVRERREPLDLITASSWISRKSFDEGLRKMRYNKLPTAILFWVELYDRLMKYSDIRELKYTYTLEHIMPQNWKANWSVSTLPVYSEKGYEITDVRDAEDVRNNAVYEIGNMTLLNSKLNTSLSNSAFLQKVNGDGNKHKYCMRDLADLYLTREVIEEERWDERNIRQRTTEIQNKIENIWGISFLEDKPLQLEYEDDNPRKSYDALFEDSYFVDVNNAIKKSVLSESEKNEYYKLLLEDVEKAYLFDDIQNPFFQDGDRVFSMDDRAVVEEISERGISIFADILLAIDDKNEAKTIQLYKQLFAQDETFALGEEAFCNKVIMAVKDLMPGFYGKLIANLEDIRVEPLVRELSPCIDLYYDDEEDDESIQELESFVQKYPESIVANYLIGCAHYNNKEWEDVPRHLQKCEGRDEYKFIDPSVIAYDIGVAFSRLRDKEMALSYFNKAIEFDTEFADAYDYKGFTLKQLMRYEEALEAYKKCLEIDGTHADASNYMVPVLIELGKLDELKEYVENPPRPLRGWATRKAEAAISGKLYSDESRDDEE